MQMDMIYFRTLFLIVGISITFSLEESNFKKTTSGVPAVLDNSQHLQIQKVFGLTTCASLCLRMLCHEFQYSDTSRTCITRHSEPISDSVLNPGSGLFDIFNDNEQDPKTCFEIRKNNPGAQSGEYKILPSTPQFEGVSVKVYCLMNDTHQMEYITLPNRNIGNLPKRSNNNCDNEQSYLQAGGVGEDGVTEYQKIRVKPSTMAVVRTDTTFTSGNKTKPHTFGTAQDCYSYSESCKRTGTFHIDTLGTGMKFSTDLKWTGKGYAGKVHSITRTQNGAVIDLVCGGWCGGCDPDGDMILYPNNLDIQP